MPELNLDELEKKYDKRLSQIQKEEPAIQTPNVSSIESGIRGGLQGLSFGFSEEAEAKLKSLINKTDYNYELEKAREANRLAQEANPIAYTGSEVAGAIAPTVASAFIPGGQAGTVAGGASIATKLPMLAKAFQGVKSLSPVAKGIASGAVSGLGYSEGQDIGEIASDVGMSAGLGGAIPGLTKGIGTAKKAIDPLVKKSLQGGLGVSSELLTEAEKNPQAVKRILNQYSGLDIKKDIIPERANIVESFMQDNPIAKRAIANSQKAVQSIPDDVMIDTKLAINALDDQIAKLGKSKGISDVRIAAIDMLNKKKIAFESLGEKIKGTELKPILQGLDDDIAQAGGWQNPLKNNAYRDGIENVRKSLDRDLKTQVPEYERLMKKVSKDYQLSNNLTKRFATEKGFDENKIANTLKTQLSKPDTNLQADLKRLSAYGRKAGQREDLNLPKLLEDLKLKQDIERYGGKGSSISNRLVGLSTMLGTSIGGLPGGVIGTGLGSIAGSEVEKNAGQMALKALEATKGIRSTTPINQQALQTFGQGASRGGTTLLNDFLSQQRSEVNRRKLMESRGQSRD